MFIKSVWNGKKEMAAARAASHFFFMILCFAGVVLNDTITVHCLLGGDYAGASLG
jgi:hypothetical protein